MPRSLPDSRWRSGWRRPPRKVLTNATRPRRRLSRFFSIWPAPWPTVNSAPPLATFPPLFATLNKIAFAELNHTPQAHYKQSHSITLKSRSNHSQITLKSHTNHTHIDADAMMFGRHNQIRRKGQNLTWIPNDDPYNLISLTLLTKLIKLSNQHRPSDRIIRSSTSTATPNLSSRFEERPSKVEHPRKKCPPSRRLGRCAAAHFNCHLN